MSKFNENNDEDLQDPKALQRALYDQISEIHSTGSFATFGVIDGFIHPGISVDSIGIVGLPLSKQDADALILMTQKAPFGKGTETLIDESFRKTWQFDEANIQFLNKKWQDCLDRIVKRVAGELGVPGESTNVRAELYKMLLYEKGARFRAHKE